MKSFKKKLNFNLIFGIVLAVLFVASIPTLIVAASRMSNPVFKVLFIFSIVFLVGGFYGMPFVWINYGTLRRCQNILTLASQGITDYPTIAEKLGTDEKEVVKLTRKLILGGYISADLIGQTPTMPKKEKTKVSITCKSCGASYLKTSEEANCPYCGKYN